MPPIHPDLLEPGMDVVYSEGAREWEGTVVELGPRIVRLEIRPPVQFYQGPDFFAPELIGPEDVLPEIQMLGYGTTSLLSKKYQLPPGHWSKVEESPRLMWVLDEPMDINLLRKLCSEMAIEPDNPMCWITSATVRNWPIRAWHGKWTEEARGVKEWRPGQRPQISGMPPEETILPKDLRPGMEVTFREFDQDYPGRVLNATRHAVFLELANPVHYLDAPYNMVAWRLKEEHYLPDSFAVHGDVMKLLDAHEIRPEGEWTTSLKGLRMFRFAVPIPLRTIRDLCAKEHHGDWCWWKASTLTVIPIDRYTSDPGDPVWYAGRTGVKEWSPPQLGLLMPERFYSVCKIVFDDRTRNDFMTFDAIVRSEFTGATVHVALPVQDLVPQAPIFAGIIRKPMPFEEIKAGLGQTAEQYGFRVDCEEGLKAEELAGFLMDPLWAAGIEGHAVEKAWTGTERILNHVLGRL